MHKIVALTGAGISKASGIPTFEEMGDLRDKLSRRYFISNPEEFYRILSTMKQNIEKAVPNAAHNALAQYGVPIVTMNVDGLHRKAGSKEVIEIHGNLDWVLCKKCGKKYEFNWVRNSLYCEECGDLLEPDVVLYGDQIPYYFNAVEMIGSADKLLVVGTSFYTSTVNDLVYMARRAGITVDTINAAAEVEVPKYLRNNHGGE